MVVEIIRKMFEANPEKSTLVLKEKCSDCGCDTTIEITHSRRIWVNGWCFI